MTLTTTIRQLRATRLAVATGIVLFAAFTALAARITIPLPFTPVPVTLQVMAVLLAGLVLGARAGGLSQLLYLAAIASGLPLDAYGLGPAALMGPTAGYLVGFAGAAFVVGWIAERWPGQRAVRFAAAVIGVGVIYGCGAAWLAATTGNGWVALKIGVVPFAAVDLAKALLAATVAESGRRLLHS
jgi:biotin transport system substrate-specific component